MMKKGMIWKGLVVGIIFLFIGVSFSPTINFNTVRASAEEKFFEVTTQALGIKGYEDTTVKLTREQYQDLEQYLDVFQEKLNQTSTREEAIPLFKEAVVELDKYGLLPKGMSVERAQRLVTFGVKNNTERPLRNNLKQELFPIFFNMFCLVSANAPRAFIIDIGFLINPISIGPLLILIITYILFGYLYLQLFYKLLELIEKSIPDFIWEIVERFFYILYFPVIFMALFLIILWHWFPIRFMNLALISMADNIDTIGLKGRVQSDGDILALIGYTGLTIGGFDSDSVYLLGSALAIKSLI